MTVDINLAYIPLLDSLGAMTSLCGADGGERDVKDVRGGGEEGGCEEWRRGEGVRGLGGSGLTWHG